jgi:hypothetical protein
MLYGIRRDPSRCRPRLPMRVYVPSFGHEWFSFHATTGERPANLASVIRSTLSNAGWGPAWIGLPDGAAYRRPGPPRRTRARGRGRRCRRGCARPPSRQAAETSTSRSLASRRIGSCSRAARARGDRRGAASVFKLIPAAPAGARSTARHGESAGTRPPAEVRGDPDMTIADAAAPRLHDQRHRLGSADRRLRGPVRVAPTSSADPSGRRSGDVRGRQSALGVCSSRRG